MRSNSVQQILARWRLDSTVDNAKMKSVSSTLKTLPRGHRREERRLERAMEARQYVRAASYGRPLGRLSDSAEARHGGRAWINGEEVGGADPRFAHLSAAFD